ncbi:universal stress protein [Halomicrobium salinisoli]|uniref:universal stress protein n=1 Tax=Halomicrobium salinisoli TaxID=2878391 RepID=UPI001CEFEABE|nr:universal stress protein [Halomicrobium salinisoli]
MFDDVLVPTDGSDCAERAVGYAVDIASRYGATVHVLSVADSRTLQHGPHSDQVRAACEEIVDETCEGIAGDVPVRDAVRTDLPHEAILAYADDEGIDLIVMGTHGRTGVERYLLGSITEKVVRLSDVPVLTVRSSDGDDVAYPYSDVLVPTDGSDGAAAAVGPAVDVADAYDARLHALSVVDTRPVGLDVRTEPPYETPEERADRAVESVAERAEAADIGEVETSVAYGVPYETIRSYVREHDVDLVVMGTRGRTGVERYLLGSVAEKTVRTSAVPVMTVHAGDVDREELDE